MTDPVDEPDPIKAIEEAIERLREELRILQNFRMDEDTEAFDDIVDTDDEEWNILDGIGSPSNLPDLVARMTPTFADDGYHQRKLKESMTSRKLAAICILGSVGIVASIAFGSIAALGVVIAFILAALKDTLS